METRAAVLYGINEPLRIETVQLADPKPRDVLVRVVASGVCGSDVHLQEGGLAPLFPNFPIVPGHEAAGIVEAVGSEVTTVAPGDHVVLGWTPGCGQCTTCWNGHPGNCRQVSFNRLYDGGTRISIDGRPVDPMAHVAGYAEYTVVGERSAIKVRADAPLEKACLVGCAAATGWGSVFNSAHVQPGASALVIGCGGVGLNVVQSLVLANATSIIAVDISAEKLAKAKEFGATHTIDGSREDVLEAVQELTRGVGVDYSFEVISTSATIQQAFTATRFGGTVVVVGVAPLGATITLPAAVGKTVMSGTTGGTQWANTELLVDLYMAGRFKLDELVSRERPLDEVNHALDDLRAGTVTRTVLRP